MKKRIIKMYYADCIDGMFAWIMENNIQDDDILAITKEGRLFKLFYLGE